MAFDWVSLCQRDLSHKGHLTALVFTSFFFLETFQNCLFNFSAFYTREKQQTPCKHLYCLKLINFFNFGGIYVNLLFFPFCLILFYLEKDYCLISFALSLGNEISQVEGLEGLHQLRELVLDRNRIKALAENSFIAQGVLLELHLAENRIRELNHLNPLTELRKLFLGMNKLQVHCQTLWHAGFCLEYYLIQHIQIFN